MTVQPPQQLIFDADDTLWENNIYFEEAFEQFVDFLNHSSLSPVEIRDVLDEIERVNQKIHGYGSLNFGRNLRQCYQHLCERDISPSDLDHVMSLAERILDQPIERMDGVEPTLRSLSRRHELLLFTKGHPDEQKLKIDRSGLGQYFSHFAIVKEKDRESYCELVRARGLDLARCWMIGNSPRSDINPALELGLGAVYIPHPRTWSLEREEIRNGDGRLLVLGAFAELRRYF